MAALPVLWPDVFPYMQTLHLGGRVIRAPGVSLVQLTIGLSAFTGAAIVQQYLRLVRMRARVQGEPLTRALGAVFSANRTRYAAHIVHVGTALMFLGFAGKPLVQHTDRVLAPGDVLRIGGVELQYHSLAYKRGADASAVQALILKREPGRAAAEVLTPGSLVYHESPDMPVNEVSIVRRLGRDLHVRLADQQGERITLKVAVHPLVSWLWLGFLVMVVGAVIGLINPRRSRPSRARVTLPVAGGRLALFLTGGVAAAWLLALGWFLAGSVPDTDTAAALSLWVVGAATVAAAAALVFTFLPTALAATAAPSAATTTVDGADGITARLVEELRQIEEDRALAKVSDADARALALPLRRDLAIVLATADAESRRDTLAASLTAAPREAGDDEERGNPEEEDR
jgi:hypothetical protein